MKHNSGPGIIIGGGIGGLAAAVALRRVGVEANVYERAPEIREVGAGLSLWSNAIKALGQLGLDQEIVRRGTIIERIRMVTERGALISDEDIGEKGRRAGAPSVCIHRADLQKVLVEALPPEALHTGCKLTRYDAAATGVTAHFAEAPAATGDFLIGADGLRSVVREQLLGPTPLRFADSVAWRGITHVEPRDLPPEMAYFVMAPGVQCGVFRCGPGRIYWFLAQRSKALGPVSQAEPGRCKQEVLDIVANWFPLVPQIVEATPESAVLRGDEFDRAPTWPWGRDRVTLLGDAIHPTTPNLGQGACQALEDAIVLGACLRDAAHVPSGLRRYEGARQARTAWVVRESRKSGAMFQMQNRLAVRIRNYMLGTRLGRRRGRALFEYLFNHELPGLGRQPAAPSRAHAGRCGREKPPVGDMT